LILIYREDQAFEALSPEETEQAMELLKPFEETVPRDGKLLSTHRLKPAASTTPIQIRGDKRSITDGPDHRD
jgi:hypothetical protein